MTAIAYYNSPLGPVILTAKGGALTGLWFLGQKDMPKEYIGAAPTEDEPAVLTETRLWLDRYFAGEKPSISTLKLAPEGSAFRRRVWDILCTIPYGETFTYGQIAKMLEAESGGKMSAQAVGGAVGHNPISIIIPCHRVIGSDGSLTGYAGGLERKTALLHLESRKK